MKESLGWIGTSGSVALVFTLCPPLKGAPFDNVLEELFLLEMLPEKPDVCRAMNEKMNLLAGLRRWRRSSPYLNFKLLID
jgi:hypothetical protein